MRRREVITLLSGAAAWPLAVRAQQGERVRRIGVLQPAVETDAQVLLLKMTFVQRLQELGWMEGRNLISEYRFGAMDVNRMPDLAKELIALQPDVILAAGTSAVVALRQNTFRSRSCSRRYRIRLRSGSSQVSRTPEATSLGSPTSTRRSAENGCRPSKTSTPALARSPLCLIRTPRPGSSMYARWRQLRRRSRYG